ncbi:MAG: CRTAC1 family protein [Candidatus Poribacteria bacterium]|nr:CRTAC1 family protein [Candidatus Poribacteria bacterium]
MIRHIVLLLFFLTFNLFPPLSECQHPLKQSVFIEVTQQSGINFTHFNGANGEYHLPETLGSGGAFFDYDQDGDVDLLLVNCGPIHSMEASTYSGSVLYRNMGNGTFSDVTTQSKLDTITGYNHGIAVADYDNDGDPDFLLTGLMSNSLYQNNGDGTFSNVTQLAGVGHSGWSSSATFFDYDRDGHLDLYVVNYVDYRFDEEFPVCKEFGVQDYCNLRYYRGTADRLYHNNGDGTFSNVTQLACIEDPGGSFQGKGLGVIATDFNNDRWPDLYVANDGTPNYLFYNNGDGTFSEIAAYTGCAYSDDGLAQAGMGVDTGDYNQDGLMDIYVTNFSEETNNLYRNNGDGTFTDCIHQVGLGNPTFLPVGFGTIFFDYDNDMDLDLFVANGHVTQHAHLKSDLLSYGQQNQLFEQWTIGQFTEVSSELSRYSEISRGVLVADYDNDGDLDLLITQLNQPTRLYQNQTVESESTHHWIRLKMVGKDSNRDGIGTRVKIEIGELSLIRDIRTSSGYLSSQDQRLTVGLGKYSIIDRLTVYWPNGDIQAWENIESNREIVLEENKVNNRQDG